MLIRFDAPVGLALGPHRYDEGMGAKDGRDQNYWLQRESEEETAAKRMHTAHGQSITRDKVSAWRTPDNTVRRFLARLTPP